MSQRVKTSACGLVLPRSSSPENGHLRKILSSFFEMVCFAFKLCITLLASIFVYYISCFCYNLFFSLVLIFHRISLIKMLTTNVNELINTLARALSTSTATRSRGTICTGSGVHLAWTPRSQSVTITHYSCGCYYHYFSHDSFNYTKDHQFINVCGKHLNQTANCAPRPRSGRSTQSTGEGVYLAWTRDRSR
jgi:hypothetical protein